jgi:ribosomal protein S18 acetylase RimI-like enzyme
MGSSKKPSSYFMIKAKTDDKALVIDLLSQSFDDNQSVNYIIRQDKKRIQRVRSLMDYSYEVCSDFGEVLVSDDRKACALLLYPHLKHTTLKSIWLDIKLIFQAIGLDGIKKAMTREAQIKKLQSKDKMTYLWFIGVDTAHQHEGIGGKLLKEIIEEANMKILPVYLETSTLQNLPWYERFGFKIYNKLELGYTLFFLKREPNKK